MATTSPSTRRSPRLGGGQQSLPSSSRRPRNNVARKLNMSTSNKTPQTKLSPDNSESIPFLAVNTPPNQHDKSPTKTKRNNSIRTKPKQKTANEALGNPQIISRRRRRAAVTPRTRGKSIANLLSSSPSNNNSTTARTGKGTSSTSSSTPYLTPGKRSAAEAILHKVSRAKSNGNNDNTTALHSSPKKKRRKIIRKAASDANEKVRDICQMDEFDDLNNISPSNLVPYNKPKISTKTTGGQEVKAGRKSKGMSELVVGDTSSVVQQQQGDIVTVDTFIPKGKVEERWFKNFKKWNSSNNNGEGENDSSSPIPKRWEKEQRAQYRLLQQNKKTQMTKDRMKLLQNSGFVWDVQQKGERKDDTKQVVSNDTVTGGKATHKTEGASTSTKEDGSSKDDSPSKRQSPRKSPPTQFYHNLEKDKGDDDKSALSKSPSTKKSTVSASSTAAKAATNTKSSPSKSPSKRSLSTTNNSLASLSTENKSENNQQQKKKKKRRGRHSTSSLFSLEGSSNDTVPVGEDSIKKESTSFSHSELKHELSKKKKRKHRKKKDTTGGTNEAAKKEEEKTSDNSDVLAATKKATDGDKQSSGKNKTGSSPAESPLRVTKLLPTLDKGASSLAAAKVSKDTADKEEPEESVCVTKLLLSCLSEDSADKGIQPNSQSPTKETTDKTDTGSKRDSSPSRKSPRKSPPTQFYHNLEKDSRDNNNKTSPEKPNIEKKKSSPRSPKKVTVSASASKWVDSPVISTPERAKLEAARAANTKDIPELGPGWEVNVVPRKPGSSKRVDKYYLSPTGQRFNSMKRAKAHAQEESDKAVSEEKTSAVQDPPSNEQKEQVKDSAKSQQQSSPWTCDVCQDATFDDYDEAVAHEKECAIASNNVSQVVESSNKEKETTISADNSTVEEETGKSLQSNDALPPAAKVNLPEQPTAPQKERPSVGSDGRQGGSWTCDVCKTATFDDYDEAVAHEEKCAIEQRENRSQKNDKVTVHHSRGKKRKSSLQSLGHPENEVAVPPADDLADNTHTKPSSSTPNDKKSSTDGLVPITATHVGNELAIVQHTAADESSLPLFSPLSLTSPLTHADNRVGDSQLQMVIAEKQYEEKMAEFGRLELEAKMVTQRMREIEQKIKGFGSNKVSNDLINMEEGYESVSHKRYQSKSKSSRRSITHNWSSHHYSSEEEQYDDRHYTPRKRRHTHMMSTNDIESRMYSGRKSRRRSDTYESQRSMSRRRGGSSRNRPSFDDYDDDSEIQEERTSKRRHRSVEHFPSPERYNSNRRSSGKRKRSNVSSKLPAFADEGPRKKKSRPKQKTQSQHLFDGIRKENSRRKPEVYRGDEYSDEETEMLHFTKPQVKSHTQSNVSHPQPAVEDNDVDKRVGAADEASGGENSSDEESWDFEAGNMILPPPPM